ncbi:MAG: oligosaccharide flippase family protein [Gemmobacter sp.]
MFRTALLILSGNAFSSLMTLLRTLIVVRLISVEDYGIAATFAISLAIVEMMSALGLQQMIVRDSRGDDPHFQAALQGFQMLRAVVLAVVLFLLAPFFAGFLGVPEVTWAYRLLALVPLLNGLKHFDIHRLNRRMSFRPLILSNAVPAVVSVLLVWPLFLLFGDFRVMLWAVLMQAVFGVAVSHLVAERRFRLVFDVAVIREGLGFGWPILVNGALLFAVFHGEKLIVGRELGMEVLAIFAMGMTLTLTPTLVMAGSLSNFFLPQVSAVKDERERFNALSLAVIQASLLGGALFLVAMLFVGGPLVHVLLGEKYAPLVPYLVWLAALQAVRVFKVGGAVLALATGHTRNPMYANVLRVALLPLGWYVVARGGSLLLLIQIAILGEILGMIVASVFSHHILKVPFRPVVLPLLLTAGVVLLSCLAVTAGGGLIAPGAPLWLALGALLLCLPGFLSMRALRDYAGKRVMTGFGE